MKETEELYLLRFRYGRAAEMLLAYKTFLFKQVQIGGQNYCQTEEQAGQTAHTLLVVYYSFIFSMFDKNGTHFITATEPFLSNLSDHGKKIRNELVDVWKKYELPITKLRHNIGFHGGTKIKSHEVGYSSLTKIPPKTAEYIMNHMAIFFLEIDKIIPPTVNYNLHIDTEKAINFLLNRAEMLKAELDDTTFTNMVDFMEKMFNNNPNSIKK
jgi:hypothetical protein